MIQYRLIPFDELSSSQFSYWESVCRENAQFESPYFQPGFAKCVNTVRKDCGVIVAEESNELRGLIPVQVPQKSHAQPIGGRLNDVHGMISHDLPDVDIQSMLQQTGLRSLSFHSAVQIPSVFESNQFETMDSPVIDLKNGYDAYLNWVRRSSRTVKRQSQKTRKMIHELGPLRYEFNSNDAGLFERIVELKRQRYLNTKTFDLFSVRWAKDLVRKVFETQTGAFGGTASALWAGDHLVAGHIGLRSQNVLHYWFPIYDPRFRIYSPGIQLILETCQQAEKHGIDKIDLGYGTQPFKEKLSNSGYQTVCGKFSGSRFSYSVSRQMHFAKKWLMATPIQPVAKSIVRTIHPSFGHWVFR